VRRVSARADVVVASNRGPISFSLGDDGRLTLRRGGGGLVSGLTSVLSTGEPVWVCAALSDGDRAAAAAAPDGRLHLDGHDTAGAKVRMLELDPLLFDRAYNAIANRTLWFVSHHLYDTALRPTFGHVWRREWAAYVDYNAAFADALADEAGDGAAVLVQDYHLSLAARQLRQRRPDLRIGHFSHTPWAEPAMFAMLPDDVARDLLLGILGADHAGFLTARWADAFLRCCADRLGGDAVVDLSARTVTYDGRQTEVAVHSLGVDGAELRERAAQADVSTRATTLRGLVGDRKVVVRIDRTELSKNIVRGLQSFGELLRTHPEWHDRVVHLAFAYPSRHDLPEYREYTALVQRAATEINDEFSKPGWVPVQLMVSDDYSRSLAALAMADVLVVNPVRDGMNLVAKEGPVLSTNGVALVLSREAGAAAELSGSSIVVNPFDICETAEAIHAGLSMDAAERRARTDRLVAAATALPPQQWFGDQLAALGALAR
jgi:trehalose 6-phosphate synthase